jgi:hypothetical protein
MMRKHIWLVAAAVVAAAAASAAADLTEADAQYYNDFGDAAKRIGKQLDKLGELFVKASSGKDYSLDCEDRATELADAYHFLENRVPPADAVTAQKDLMSSADLGAQAALGLAEFFDAEFTSKEKKTRALDFYEQAVAKYADALAAAPAEVLKNP